MLSLEEHYKNTLEMLDEQTRQRSVIDFISSHQGCTAEDIVNGNKLTGRGKTFRILKELKREKVIAEQKSDKNRRDKKLYLNDTNPLVSFPKEVKEFKDHLYPLFRKAQHLRVGWEHRKEYYPSHELLGECFCLFFEYLNINNYRAFVIWPNTIKDKETLSKLYTLFYSEMTKLNLELREKFQPVALGHFSKKKKKLTAMGMDSDEYLAIARDVANEFFIADDFQYRKYQNTFYSYKSDNVSRPTIQSLMKMRSEIYDTQVVTKSEQYLASEEFAKSELEKQKGHEKLAKELKAIDFENAYDRKNRKKIPYSYMKEYDPLAGRTIKHKVLNLT
jgi:hypothetical protein